MLVSMKAILDDANENNYGVMAMNSINMEMARAGTLSAPLRRTWVSPAPQSNGPLVILFGWAEWRSSPVTGRTAARPPTCTDYGNESRRKNSLPTKGRLRQLTGPGAGSLWPTQKVPEEGLLSSENRNTFLS